MVEKAAWYFMDAVLKNRGSLLTRRGPPSKNIRKQGSTACRSERSRGVEEVL